MPVSYDFYEMAQQLVSNPDAKFTMTVACESLREFTFDAPSAVQNDLVRNTNRKEGKQQPQFYVFKNDTRQMVLQAYDEDRNILVNIYIRIPNKKIRKTLVHVYITNPSLRSERDGYGQSHTLELSGEELLQFHFALTENNDVTLIEKTDVIKKYKESHNLIF